MNATKTNVGGWKASELRAKMNSGEIWNLMPSDFQSKVKTVKKLTNNVSGADEDAAVTATLDKLFLLSYSEIAPSSYWATSYPWTSSEGTQYEAFKGKVTENYWNSNGEIDVNEMHVWTRSALPDKYDSKYFISYGDHYLPSDIYCYATSKCCVLPAFCFLISR